jgi:hypothetical protein
MQKMILDACGNSPLNNKLQMLFWADQLHFFGQQESVMEPVQPVFGFKPTVVSLPSVSKIVILMVPYTSAIICVSSHKTLSLI